ncbi:unnamed protein product [Larinioides sclopetarius]|uniref:Uncharacterized protein n=2 Tax=Larinioides sclopetarius TaxID=280406 RepID=A0AAV1ZT08_9ARAC
MLPSRIKSKGEQCIKNVTQTSNLREQWMKICSSKDLFYMVFLCTDIVKGAPTGAKGQKEKKDMLKYVACIYKLKEKHCVHKHQHEDKLSTVHPYHDRIYWNH